MNTKVNFQEHRCASIAPNLQFSKQKHSFVHTFKPQTHMFLNAPVFVLKEHACSSQDLCANFEAPTTITCDQKVCCCLSRIFSLFTGLLLVLKVYSCTLKLSCVKISFCIFTFVIRRCTFNTLGNISLHCNWEVHICAFVLVNIPLYSQKNHTYVLGKCTCVFRKYIFWRISKVLVVLLKAYFYTSKVYSTISENSL